MFRTMQVHLPAWKQNRANPSVRADACQCERFCNRPSGKGSGRFAAFPLSIHNSWSSSKQTASSRKPRDCLSQLDFAARV